MGHVDSLGGPMMPLKKTCINKDYVSLHPVLTVKSIKAYWTGYSSVFFLWSPSYFRTRFPRITLCLLCPFILHGFLFFLGMRQQT